MNKLIILPTVLIIIVAGFLTIPSEPTNSIVFEIPDTNESKIVVGDVELIISNDDITDITILDQILSEPPDITIPINSELPLSILNEVQYSFDEDIVTDKIAVNKYELLRTITYNDGSVDKQTTFSELISLDFLTLDDDPKEFDKGKISFKLTVPIQKPIRLAQGEFTFYYIESGESKNIKTVNYVFNTKSQSDVTDNTLTMLDNEIQLSSFLSSSSLGIHEFKVTLDKLFITYDDNSREYANPTTIYSVTIEKSNSQSIITNEDQNIRVWDYDIPLTISTATQSVTADTCVSSSSGSCTQYFQSFYKVASPKLGQITITNLDTNTELVRTDVVSKSSCINKINNVNINLCDSVGDGTKFTFILQRNNSYKISIGSPQNESFIINTPKTDDSYDYACLTTTTQTKIPTTKDLCQPHQFRTFSGDPENGSCSERYNTSRGQAWYNYGWRNVSFYDYDTQLTCNFPQ